jgi:hypothetical protein
MINSQTKDKTVQKSWIWPNAKGGVEGAYIDLDDGTIQWYNEPGCSCAGSDSEQKIEDFITNGPRYIVPPDDILGEMRSFIQDKIPS